MEIAQDILYRLEAAMEQWTDQREISADDLLDVLMFILHLDAVLLKSGQRVGGFTFRHKGDQVLLTVKVKEGDIPLVAYVTGPNPTACVSRFFSLYERDKLSWSKDRYPWI